MIKQKHSWVTFYNPRNGRVQISACSNCGMAKDPRAQFVECKVKSVEDHGMKKMGWEEMPRAVNY